MPALARRAVFFFEVFLEPDPVEVFFADFLPDFFDDAFLPEAFFVPRRAVADVPRRDVFFAARLAVFLPDFLPALAAVVRVAFRVAFLPAFLAVFLALFFVVGEPDFFVVFRDAAFLATVFRPGLVRVREAVFRVVLLAMARSIPSLDD